MINSLSSLVGGPASFGDDFCRDCLSCQPVAYQFVVSQNIPRARGNLSSPGVVLAPPFVLAFTAGSFIYPQPVEPKTKDQVGPTSTYFYQERSSRRWKLLIFAGLIAAVTSC